MTRVLYLSPDGFDYSSNQMTEGLKLMCDGRQIESFLCTSKTDHHGSKTKDVQVIGWDAARDELDRSDIIMMSSGGDMSFTTGLRGEVLESGKYVDKLIFLDGHDSNALLVDPKKVTVYLKRELRYPEAIMYAIPNIRSLTFGVYQFHFDERRPMYRERDIDVAFVAFGGSSPLRKDCVEVLQKAQGAGLFKTVFAVAEPDRQPLTLEEYKQVMLRSKVIISVPGAGLDTLRFWEAMGYGAVLASLDITKHLYIRNHPEPIRQAMYAESWGVLVDLIKLVVNDEQRWTRMRKSTDHMLWQHSTLSRASQALDMFRELQDR
jgi:hypothetical protein